MPENVHANDISVALSKAREVLNRISVAKFEQTRAVHKTIWGSPAGKKRLSEKLAGMLPPHKTYVEPFAGSAAVLFAKEPSDLEVICDADVEIARAYRCVKKLSAEQMKRLRAKSWKGDPATFKQLINQNPGNDVDSLYRFLYLTHFSYGKLRGKSFSPSGAGVEAKTMSRVEAFAPRLKNVRVYDGDYLKVVQKYDGPNTAFFLDPPYSEYNVNVGESQFDDERFFKALTSIKGKFLMTCGIRGKLPQLLKKSRFNVQRIRTRRTIRSMRGVGGPEFLTQLLVTNYQPAKKCWAGSNQLNDQWIVEDLPDFNSQTPEQLAPAIESQFGFSKDVPLIKGLDDNDERFVLGVVLTPNEVDAQGDIYSAEEIRQAAHRFMEEFGGLGLMHRFRVNDQVKVLESYLAPADLEIEGMRIPKGTWILAVRILSDDLWEQIRTGQLTGFSIGGSARRIAEELPFAAGAQEDAPRQNAPESASQSEETEDAA